MSMCPARFLRFLAAAALAATCVSATASDFLQERFEGRLNRAWEERAQPGGLAALLWAEQFRDDVADPAPLVATAERLVAAQDTRECTRALAIYQLARDRANAGRVQEADELSSRLGYLTDWTVVGPFADDSKEGFDAVYPPEEGPDFSATYEGKGHPVSWRAVPPLRGREVVPLDGMLDPSSKVAGYAATFVRMPADTPAVLRGGFNEAVKVWVDGELVGSKKVYSGRVFDKYSFPCTLRKGWNLILVKLCNQEAGWNFSLRVTDGAGKTLGGWVSTASPSGAGETVKAMLAKDGAASSRMVWDDPESALRERAEKESGPGPAADYAFYLSVRQPFDRVGQDDVRAFEEAVSRDPASTELLCALGDSHEDHNLARKAYQAALERRPDDPEANWRMAEHYRAMGMAFPALDYLSKALAADPGNPLLEAARARVRLRFAADGLAGRELVALAEKHPGSIALHRARMEAARTLGLEDLLFRATLAHRESNQEVVDAWMMAISALRTRGADERAEVLMADARARFPFNLILAQDQAERWVATGRPEKARESIGAILGWASDWADGHRLLGDALAALGQPVEALRAYQSSLILKPQQEALKTKVAFLDPEKDGFEVACRIPDADVPADLSKFAGEPLVVLLDNTAVEVQPSGLSSRYFQRLYKVLETGAVRELQSYAITFDPDREEVKVLEASILKPDGRKVHAESYSTDRLAQPQYRLYYRSRNLVLTFPSLAAGDRVRIEYKVSDVGEANDYGRYFGYLEGFGEGAPVLLKQFTLILPADFPLHIRAERVPVEPIVLTREGRKTYRWVARDLERIQTEPGMPGVPEVAPYLHLSTFNDWGAMGTWYAQFIRDQWELTPDIKRLVGELTAGKKTEEERVRALHRWVVQQTRYVGLEFGVHGIRPYKVRQIYERRFGDCKDKAILLSAMLREAGIDACMVLIRTRDLGELAPEPASLAIFNHAICFVPGLDLFLDGTAEYSGLRELPHQDQGVWTLLVWPDGRTERRRTPEASSAENRFEAQYTVTLAEGSADADFEARITFVGEECAWVRQRYQDPGKRASLMEQDLSGSYPGTRIREAEYSDLSDLSTPVKGLLRGTLGRVARPDGEGRVSLPLWMGRTELSSRLGSLTRRRFDLLNDYPWRQSYEIAYELPAGAVPEAPADASVETEFGTARRTVRHEGGRVVARVEIALEVRRVTPDRYPAFREFCTQVDALAAQRLRLSNASR